MSPGKEGVRDGYLLLNLDTLGKPFKKKSSKTKESKILFQAVQDAIINKRKINAQVAFIVKFFRYETKGIGKPNFMDQIEDALKEMKPLYDFLKTDY